MSPGSLFLRSDAAGQRLPVALLSGFLGSGKTTLINALLRDPRLAGTAVAVNEFGETPLDHELIDHGGDRTVVMANGCLCCNLAGDMEEAVMRLFSRRSAGAIPRFERLIIEPSGLSDPAPIAQAILRNPVMSRAMRLEAIITTVDCLFGASRFETYAETRKQAALADQLVLTKTDMADPAAVEGLRADLRSLNPLAPIHSSQHGAIDAASIFPAGFLSPSAGSPQPRSYLFADAVPDDTGPRHLADTVAVSLDVGQPLIWRAFEAWLRVIRLHHAERLLRVKGILDIDGVSGPVVVNGIHHVLHAPVELDAWVAATRRSRLVLIADSATGAAIQSSWNDALPGLLAA